MRGDLVRILGELAAKREAGRLHFDRVVIETTGLAMRYEGVPNIQGVSGRVIFQGVHMLMGSDEGTAWKPGEERESKMVFIGEGMPKEVLLAGLARCVLGKSATPRH